MSQTLVLASSGARQAGSVIRIVGLVLMIFGCTMLVPLATALIPPIVTIGGVPVEVQFAGLTPGEIGVYQINVRVTDTVPLGLSVPLDIRQGSGSTSLSVRVVQ